VCAERINKKGGTGGIFFHRHLTFGAVGCIFAGDRSISTLGGRYNMALGITNEIAFFATHMGLLPLPFRSDHIFSNTHSSGWQGKGCEIPFQSRTFVWRQETSISIRCMLESLPYRSTHNHIVITVSSLSPCIAKVYRYCRERMHNVWRLGPHYISSVPSPLLVTKR